MFTSVSVGPVSARPWVSLDVVDGACRNEQDACKKKQDKKKSAVPSNLIKRTRALHQIGITRWRVR